MLYSGCGNGSVRCFSGDGGGRGGGSGDSSDKQCLLSMSGVAIRG